MTALIEKKKYTEEAGEAEVKIDVHLFRKLVEMGMFKEDDRIELINGRMFEMTPIGLRHMSVVNKLSKLLNDLSGKNFIVSIQNALRLNEYSELYPDIVILRYREDFYTNNYPDVEMDVFLAIEVADTSLNYDRYKKLPLYAEAKISEVWIINLQEDVVEIYQNPDFEKKEYLLIKKLRIGEAKPSRIENVNLKVEDIFIK